MVSEYVQRLFLEDKARDVTLEVCVLKHVLRLIFWTMNSHSALY